MDSLERPRSASYEPRNCSDGQLQHVDHGDGSCRYLRHCRCDGDDTWWNKCSQPERPLHLRPAVTNLSQHTGPAAGGTSVTVTGNGFTGATAVNFGATAGSSLVVNSNTSITVTSPAESAGTVNVTVVTPSGTSPVVGGDSFTFTTAAPSVTSISPSSGPAAGGTTVTGDGYGLSGATQVYFGSVAAEGVQNGTETDLTAQAPPGTAGTTVAVTVQTPGGTSAPVALGQYTYGATVTHITRQAARLMVVLRSPSLGLVSLELLR